jgi:hypothetical protein
MRMVWGMCVLVLMLGALFFYLHLVASEVSPVPIASIDSWLDYSYVWVEGVVVSGPQYGPTSLSFDLWDGSSEDFGEATLRVEVFSPAFQELVKENRIPRVGDHVLAFGQLRVPSIAERELRVSFPDDIEITAAEPIVAALSEILDSPESYRYRRVAVEGTITDVEPKASAKLYYLEDEGREIQVYIHNGLESFLEERPLDINVLDRVRVEAGLAEFEGRLQLAVARFDEIQVLHRENIPELSLEDVDERLLDNFVRIGGRILFVELEGTGNSLEISRRILWLENEGYPRVVVDEGKLGLLGRELQSMIRRGSRIELIGKVSRYGDGIAVFWVGPQTPSIEAGEWAPDPVENFSAIDSSWRGRLVSITGRVTSVYGQFRPGLPDDRVLVLEDNHGNSVRVYVPNYVYERLTRPPATGQTVAVVGQVVDMPSLGSIVVRPGSMEDIEVVQWL